MWDNFVNDEDDTKKRIKRNQQIDQSVQIDQIDQSDQIDQTRLISRFISENLVKFDKQIAENIKILLSVCEWVCECVSECVRFDLIELLTQLKTQNNNNFHKYCANIVIVLYKYGQKIVQILRKKCANIVQILY